MRKNKCVSRIVMILSFCSCLIIPTLVGCETLSGNQSTKGSAFDEAVFQDNTQISATGVDDKTTNIKDKNLSPKSATTTIDIMVASQSSDDNSPDADSLTSDTSTSDSSTGTAKHSDSSQAQSDSNQVPSDPTVNEKNESSDTSSDVTYSQPDDVKSSNAKSDNKANASFE